MSGHPKPIVAAVNGAAVGGGFTRLVAAAMAANEPDDDGQRGVVVNTGVDRRHRGPDRPGRLRRGQGRHPRHDPARWPATCAAVGIRVCAIAPGTMGTPLMLGAPEAAAGERSVEQHRLPPSAWASPRSSPSSSSPSARNPYLNGENIRLDGALRFPPEVRPGAPRPVVTPVVPREGQRTMSDATAPEAPSYGQRVSDLARERPEEIALVVAAVDGSEEQSSPVPTSTAGPPRSPRALAAAASGWPTACRWGSATHRRWSCPCSRRGRWAPPRCPCAGTSRTGM